MTAESSPELPLIGWRERLALPDLPVTSVKAKIDTGARSSALHAEDIEFFEREGEKFVRFKVHPSQSSKTKFITAEAKLLDIRSVKSSSGQAESRPVIETTVSTKHCQWTVELTLTNRDLMGFRMLLGRQAVRRRFLVDSGRSYLQTDAPKHKLKASKKRQQQKKIKTSQKTTHENSNFVEKLRTLFNSPN
ncbi:MAG: RimK/LysX family protein [Cyanobacteria bacterium J06621_11]